MVTFFKQSAAQRTGANRESGFTLIEMAVVLMLFGVIVSGAVLGFSHVTYKLKADATQERFDLVFNALSAYAQRYNRLPCPGDPNGGGVERANGNCFNNASLSALYGSVQGVVPWRELGLPEAAVRDGWGRFLTYKPAPQLTVNYLSAQMQNNDAGTVDLDIHDACRSATWYTSRDDGSGALVHTHVDRAKALFCCNRQPNSGYLTANGAGPNLPGGWRNQAIVAAGLVNASAMGTGSQIPNNTSVKSTNAWMDEGDNTGIAINGDFDVPDHGITGDAAPDSPLQRAMGQAVTLISHGGNGYLSFLRGQPAATRLQATVNGGSINAAASMADDERLNVWPPQVVAGSSYHPKVSNAAYDPFGRRAGASDDRVAFLRTDQMMARLGSDSCLRPASTDPMELVCPPNGLYGDVSYVLDTSGSMDSKFNGGSLGNTRIKVAKNALKLVIPEHIGQEIENDIEDPDMVGFNRFGTKNGGCSVKNTTTGTIYSGFDSNQDGTVDDSDSVDPDTLTAAQNNLITQIDAAKADGLTPIAQTLRVTADEMAKASAGGTNGSTTEPNAIVFISDGYDTCGGNVIDTAKYIAQKYPNLHVHIVDVANNPDLAKMHNEFTVNGKKYKMKGKYIKASDGEDVIRSLMNLSGQCNSI